MTVCFIILQRDGILYGHAMAGYSVCTCHGMSVLNFKQWFDENISKHL